MKKNILYLICLTNYLCNVLDGKMLKIGHRGACGYEQENTLASIEKAIQLGVDMVEFDVHLCKTGQLVVIHDFTVNRTTNGDGYVKDFSLEELKSLKLMDGQQIPTLEEVLDLIDRRIGVNIELKGRGVFWNTALLIRRYVLEKGWSYDNFLISSFNHYELLEFKYLVPEVKIAPLYVGIPLGYAKFAENLKAYSVNLSSAFINKEFVDDAHSRGIKVFVFTINDIKEFRRMEKLGVDGIFSDYPDIFPF